MASLSVTIDGVKFTNPVVVGSASPTMNYKGIKKSIDGGAGAAIAKSLFGDSGSAGREYPRPRYKLYDYKDYPGYPEKLPQSFTLNSLEEASNFNYDEYMQDINRAKDAVGNSGIVIASLAGSSMEEWEIMARMANESKADWVELNISCPFAADMGIKMGAGAVELAPAVTRKCASILHKPFSVKISPQAFDPVAIAKEIANSGASAVNMSARLSGFDLDIETAKPIGWGSVGGYGGPYLLGYGLKFVGLAAQSINVPIISGLGVWKWQDIIKYIMAGASLVQSATAIMLQGYNITQKWIGNINAWMDQKGYEDIEEIRGIALSNIKTTKEVKRYPEGVFARVDFNRCKICGVCKKSCFYDAIRITKAGAIVNSKLCDGCGMCMEVCPYDAISMTG